MTTRRTMPINKWLPLCLAALLCAACDRPAPEPAPVRDDDDMRIVTLAPALTRMIVDLDRGGAIVGVGEHDAVAPDDAPVVGNFMNINSERLLNLRPTHVLMMADRHGAPESLQSLARSGGFELVTFTYPDSVTDVVDVLFNHAPDQPDVGAVLGASVAAQRLHLRILRQLGEIGRITGEVDKPDVLLVIGVEPTVRASAPGETGTVLDDLLGFAGGLNAAADAPVSAPTYNREQLLALQPEAILLLLPGDPPLTEGDSRLAPFERLDMPATRDDRITLINDPLVLLPGSNIADVAATMAKAIHPDLADRIDQVMEAP